MTEAESAPAGPGPAPAGPGAVAGALETGSSPGSDGSSWTPICGTAALVSGAATSPSSPDGESELEDAVPLAAEPVLATVSGTASASVLGGARPETLGCVALSAGLPVPPGAATNR
jgi:hypothetical protein